MKVVFTGAAGGHFYPLIAVAEALSDIVAERRLVTPRMYYLSDKAYDEQALFANNIEFVRIPAGKVRRYFSFQNFTDALKTFQGFFAALFTLFRIYPDVIISKGSYASVPVVLAASLLRIPIIIHESDAKPGRANLLAAKHATRIAVSYDSSIQYFKVEVRGKIARVGIPIRKALQNPSPKTDAIARLGLDATVPTVLVVGGSSGAQRINETLVDALTDILPGANVIHQTGKANFDSVKALSSVITEKSPFAARYHAFPFLAGAEFQDAVGACDLVVSRAGATSIAEISLWQKPAILIPIPEDVSHDQRTNAYAYAHTGAAVVLEEANLTHHVLSSEIHRILTDHTAAAGMIARAAGFANPNAARVIAEEIVRISISHEPGQLTESTT